MLHKIVIFIFLEDPIFLADFDEANPCYVLPCGKGHLLRNWGWPLADIWQETKDLIPAAYKDLNAATKHISLEVDSSPAKLQMRPQL